MVKNFLDRGELAAYNQWIHMEKALMRTAPYGIQQRDRATVLKAWLGETGLRNTSELTVRSPAGAEGCPDSHRYQGSKEAPCLGGNAGGTGE